MYPAPHFGGQVRIAIPPLIADSGIQQRQRRPAVAASYQSVQVHLVKVQLVQGVLVPDLGSQELAVAEQAVRRLAQGLSHLQARLEEAEEMLAEAERQIAANVNLKHVLENLVVQWAHAATAVPA